uniref:Uncharacterized protein n=1 Tax=Percolomonas cosmopolitus TaxID=63605 RepID=A0A7S1PGV8_9EUKA|mmetsp:Transcript_4213/g.15886  ORF Transcript_4213/g.15886 Transcript_4213/m.15886 type:complete len:223 (+) Transcript_4213:1279-1947(+)|eukprot:CAMPEP_0117438534 /NCGR_PEP_ID=MMETSP0759-20121206/2102_1 /TAXON_ID=63605 /ORGANISM="Percolomonas cosmopolitus, Strain WS" /LENGTH=222 /DNA_ID=CAMNT_0005230227 /DNA_START=1272 /DNA_END=1940 /DNA_ORIENTATION=+
MPSCIRVNEQWVTDCISHRRLITSFFLYPPEMKHIEEVLGEGEEKDKMDPEDKMASRDIRSDHEEDDEFVPNEEKEERKTLPKERGDDPPKEKSSAVNKKSKKSTLKKNKSPMTKKRKRDSDSSESKIQPSKKKCKKASKNNAAVAPNRASPNVAKVPLKAPNKLRSTLTDKTPEKKTKFLSDNNKVVKKKKAFKPPSLKSSPTPRKKTVKKVGKVNSVLEE